MYADTKYLHSYVHMYVRMYVDINTFVISNYKVIFDDINNRKVAIFRTTANRFWGLRHFGFRVDSGFRVYAGAFYAAKRR